MVRIDYGEAIREIVRRPRSPADFTSVLNAIRDGSLMPALDDLTAWPIPLDEDDRNRELGMLLAMLTGFERRAPDPELEARVRARVLALASAGQ